MTLQPTTAKELQQIVKENERLLPVGSGTKPALSTATNGQTIVDVSQLSGIIDYEPGEYTFTAYAGTRLSQVQAALTEYGQYLPFDPLLVDKEATLGGVVAANTAGSGRYRYGGVRDFILGINFVDGRGELVRSGGKVVKNSAGFDLPKFMVGSLGRYAMFVSFSFKVFPQPRAYITLKATYSGLAATLEIITRLFTAPYEMDALDLQPLDDGRFNLLMRLGGLPNALPRRIRRLRTFLQEHSTVEATEVIEEDAEVALWQQMNSLDWVPAAQALVKIPLSPKQVPLLENVQQPNPPLRRYTCGGNVAWLAVQSSTEKLESLDSTLTKLGLSGLVLYGPPGRPIIGRRQGIVLAQRVKQALDPAGKFLPL